MSLFKKIKKTKNPTLQQCSEIFLLRYRILPAVLGKGVYEKILDVVEDAAVKEDSYWNRVVEDGKPRYYCNVCNYRSAIAQKRCSCCGAYKADETGHVRIVR